MRPMRAGWSGWVLMAGLSVGLGACDDTPPPAPAHTPAPGFDAATAQQLFDRLDRLVGALEAMPRASGALVVPVEATAERTPVVDRTNELEARIDALERVVAMLRPPSLNSFTPARAAPAPPMQMHALEQMKSQLASKDQALEARRSVFGLTQQQVLERFGVPTRVDAEKDYTRHWTWYSVDGAQLCVVTFVDGLATSIH